MRKINNPKYTYSMNFKKIHNKFINQFLIDGKKYNSFSIFDNVMYFLHKNNKNNIKIIRSIFEIIEPLFYIEKIIFFRKLKQHILFLPLKKKVKAILTILKQSTLKSKKNKLNSLSYNLSQEILMSLFKTSNTYNSYKLQNINFLKLKNNINYKWQ